MSVTGEQPEAALSKSSPVALGLALVACAGVLAGGIAWGDARSRLGTVEENAVELKARVQRAEDATAQHAITDAAVQADVRNIKESVGDLNRKMDRLLDQRGVVRRAGGGE